MRNRIGRTLAMLGLSVCILVGGAVSGVAAEPASKECKDGEHEWVVEESYKDDCVPTNFSLDGKTVTLCPHCGKEGKEHPEERLTKVKNTFSNFSNLEVYEGTLKSGQQVMTVAFYYPSYIRTTLCAKCGKVRETETIKARVMTSNVVANIEIPAEALNGHSLVLVNADGTKTPVTVSISENGRKAFFQLNMASGAQLLELV